MMIWAIMRDSPIRSKVLQAKGRPPQCVNPSGRRQHLQVPTKPRWLSQSIKTYLYAIYLLIWLILTQAYFCDKIAREHLYWPQNILANLTVWSPRRRSPLFLGSLERKCGPKAALLVALASAIDDNPTTLKQQIDRIETNKHKSISVCVYVLKRSKCQCCSSRNFQSFRVLNLRSWLLCFTTGADRNRNNENKNKNKSHLRL